MMTGLEIKSSDITPDSLHFGASEKRLRVLFQCKGSGLINYKNCVFRILLFRIIHNWRTKKPEERKIGQTEQV